MARRDEFGWNGMGGVDYILGYFVKRVHHIMYVSMCVCRMYILGMHAFIGNIRNILSLH